MKRNLLIIVIILSLIGICYAEATYEKVSDTALKVTEINEVVTTSEYTIQDLKTRKAEYEKNRAEFIVDIDARIANIDKKLSEAEKLGIKEEEKEK